MGEPVARGHILEWIEKLFLSVANTKANLELVATKDGGKEGGKVIVNGVH